MTVILIWTALSFILAPIMGTALRRLGDGDDTMTDGGRESLGGKVADIRGAA